MIDPKCWNDDAVIDICETILTNYIRDYKIAVSQNKRAKTKNTKLEVKSIREVMCSDFFQALFRVAGTSVEQIITSVEGREVYNEWQRVHDEN